MPRAARPARSTRSRACATGSTSPSATRAPQAEASVSHARTSADARVRLVSAQRELAIARQAQDPVDALDAARRAIRHAEDAKALADYARLGGR
ncbi:hypothetical protein [Microbacterium ulmi]|uniref:hypothetical protein n=1 Tax=Microbacterium ulmi TaxID=179095 RepID=UPI00201D32E8|nr:hypothetical protein [Microbacterium ulmi]